MFLPALISVARRTAYQVIVQSLRNENECFIIYFDNLINLDDKVALGKLLQISSHSFPAAPVLLAQRQRTSFV